MRLEIEETKTTHIRSNESLAPSSGLGSEDDEQENTARELIRGRGGVTGVITWASVGSRELSRGRGWNYVGGVEITRVITWARVGSHE